MYIFMYLLCFCTYIVSVIIKNWVFSVCFSLTTSCCFGEGYNLNLIQMFPYATIEIICKTDTQRSTSPVEIVPNILYKYFISIIHNSLKNINIQAHVVKAVLFNACFFVTFFHYFAVSAKILALSTNDFNMITVLFLFYCGNIFMKSFPKCMSTFCLNRNYKWYTRSLLNRAIFYLQTLFLRTINNIAYTYLIYLLLFLSWRRCNAFRKWHNTQRFLHC